MPLQNVPPALPDLVLRLGFAGNRELPADSAPLDDALDAILATVAGELLAVLPPAAEKQASERITRFYSGNTPCLRLITGLAEGADERAALALERLQANPATARTVRPELAAILPFDLPSYAASRAENFRAAFDARLRQCAYLLLLDGIHEPKRDGEPELSAVRRNRAYRAQAATLLRHADILVAALDLRAEGKPGGTLETIKTALAFAQPVILIDLGADAAIQPVEPGEDLNDVLDKLRLARGKAPDAAAAVWPKQLRQWVRRIVADPDFPLRENAAKTGAASGDERPPDAAETQRRQQASRRSQQTIAEYFSATACPPLRLVDGAPKRRASMRERVWNGFERRFRRPFAGEAPDEKLASFGAYRDRATALSSHYSGLYRGAFVLNYALAVGAVLLAALSLVLIGIVSVHHAREAAGESGGHGGHGGGWLSAGALALAALALGKLGLLLWINRNTEQSKHGDWSNRAIDCRYLAERLRAMYYLPLVGSFQPPSTTPPKYASRHVRQSSVDWLFEAIVRSVSPAEIFSSRSGSPAAAQAVPTQRVAAIPNLSAIEKNWIGKACDLRDPAAHPGSGQIGYHQRNADTHARLYERMDKWVSRLNVAVIGVVLIDIALMCLRWDQDHFWAPWLVFIAAVLPAAVASLNGLRFQSECQRLADRSAVMADLLADRAAQARHLQEAIKKAREADEDDLGSYNLEALKLTESVAQDLIEEVAEWSVLYAKDVTDT